MMKQRRRDENKRLSYSQEIRVVTVMLAMRLHAWSQDQWSHSLQKAC